MMTKEMFMETLLPVLGAGLVLAMMAFGAAILLRRNAAEVRRRYWLIALATLIVLWPLEMILPDWRVDVPVTLESSGGAFDETPSVGMMSGETSSGIGLASGGFDGKVALPAGPEKGVTSMGAGWSQLSALQGLGLLWAAGVAVLLARLVVGRVVLWHLWRRSEAASEAWDALAGRVAGTLGLRRAVGLRISDRARVPMVWGISRPRVLLPMAANELDGKAREALLLHELSHIASRDAFALTLGQVAVAAHWPNPLAWLALGRLRLFQERACDDVVVTAQGSAEDYAELLLRVARGGGRAPSVAMTMAQPSTLKKRVVAILDEGTVRGQRGGVRLVVMGSVFVVLSLGLAGVGFGEKKAVEGDQDAVDGGSSGLEISSSKQSTTKSDEGMENLFSGGVAEGSNAAKQLLESLPMDGKHEIVVHIKDGEVARAQVKGGGRGDGAGKGKAEWKGPSLFEQIRALGESKGSHEVKATAVGGRLYSATMTTMTQEMETEALLKKVVIEEVDFEDVPLPDVLDFFVNKSREKDPDGKGINVILMREALGSVERERYVRKGMTDRLHEARAILDVVRLDFLKLSEELISHEIDSMKRALESVRTQQVAANAEGVAAIKELKAIEGKDPQEAGAYYYLQHSPEHPVVKACAAIVDAENGGGLLLRGRRIGLRVGALLRLRGSRRRRFPGLGATPATSGVERRCAACAGASGKFRTLRWAARLKPNAGRRSLRLPVSRAGKLRYAHHGQRSARARGRVHAGPGCAESGAPDYFRPPESPIPPPRHRKRYPRATSPGEDEAIPAPSRPRNALKKRACPRGPPRPPRGKNS